MNRSERIRQLKDGTLTSKERARRNELLKRGVPKYVRCYDVGWDGPKDRYTVVFTGGYNKLGRVTGRDKIPDVHYYIGMSENPLREDGIYRMKKTRGKSIDISNWGYAPSIGNYCFLGKRIPFKALPRDCRKIVLICYKKLWKMDKRGIKRWPKWTRRPTKRTNSQ